MLKHDAGRDADSDRSQQGKVHELPGKALWCPKSRNGQALKRGAIGDGRGEHDGGRLGLFSPPNAGSDLSVGSDFVADRSNFTRRCPDASLSLRLDGSEICPGAGSARTPRRVRHGQPLGSLLGGGPVERRSAACIQATPGTSTRAFAGADQPRTVRSGSPARSAARRS